MIAGYHASMVASADLGDRLVEALHSVHGQHDGHRAAHAKGTCCTATFTATDAARKLTRAAHFQATSVPAKVRFSNGSGIPAYPDYARSDGRGIAVKFDLPDGTHADMVGLTLPVFFARDPEAFMEFLTVTRPDPETRQPDLAKVGEFLERHPETQAALGAAMSGELPASYLTVAYNSLHAFGLEDAEGRTTWARYRWEPELGEVSVSGDEARAGGREYLQDELRSRLAAGPGGLRLKFILAGEGDSLIDPTSAWPPDREVVDAGRLEVTAVTAEACEGVVFDPTNVVDGITCSDDPILHARSVAYARSFADRRGITAPAAAPPADAAADTGARALQSAADLGEGAMMAVDVAGVRVAVARVGGELHAFQDTCTHRGCSLADGQLSGATVSCPCHGSQFDVVTGEVVRGPARDALQTFA
jgi:catalase